MTIRDIVVTQLKLIIADSSSFPVPPEIDDTMLLSAFQLDSIAFTHLLVRLEEQLGFIPNGILRGIAYPHTVGELVAAYEQGASP